MAAITTGVGSPGAISSASGGLVSGTNTLSTIPQQILSVNPSRQSFTVHNPGTVDAYVAQTTQLVGGTDAPFTPSFPSALGGCFLVFANGGTLEISGECQKAWQAFSASGSNNPLTVMVSRV